VNGLTGPGGGWSKAAWTKRRSPQAKRSSAPAAERALAEAEARRADIDARVRAMPEERSGRKGPEPVRYGDWEVKGLTSDF
jgi:hypothetical protein